MDMMDTEHLARGSLTARDAFDMFLEGTGSCGDMSLAGFLLQHCVGGGVRSVASIGMGSPGEFLTLNALADHGGNFVFLNPDHRGRDRQRLTELSELLETRGFPMRVLIADLTLPTRWPGLIRALSQGDVRVVGLDAAWARVDSEFWSNLASFIRSGDRVVYVRGALDYQHPENSIEFLRTMPINHGLEVVAATRGSVWFAAAGEAASAIRETLHTSGVFMRSGVAEHAGSDMALVVHNDDASRLMDPSGAFPRVVHSAGKDRTAAFEFGPGWSTAESDGSWTDGGEAHASIELPRGTTEITRLRVVGNAWVPPHDEGQLVEIGVGHDPQEWIALHTDDGKISTINVPVSARDIANGRIAITFRVEKPGRPSDHGGTDSRLLGFKLRQIAVFT